MHDAQLAFLVLALIAAWLMVRAGLVKQLLEWRKPDRFCPSCGRVARDCGCS